MIRDARLALGGVATKPWRAHRAEDILVGERADVDVFVRAAAAELAPAITRPMNGFKAELARRDPRPRATDRRRARRRTA